VLICTLTSIAQSVGANRIVPALGIPHPLGDPSLSAGDERKKRRQLVQKALQALTTPISEQTIF
jgi:glycine reductase